MAEIWDQPRIQKYIDDQTEESLTLEYKAALALAREESKRFEITKDVSAMANSMGGLIIYGVAEFQQPDRKHLPEKIDPIDRSQFSKEWLEQVINNIHPKIDDVIIYPVEINTSLNHVVYVVTIPQSTTAHQARDKRYYKRFNFLAEPMDDYEIRDIMGRSKHPNISLLFFIVLTTDSEMSSAGVSGIPKTAYFTKITLAIFAVNDGAILANYLNANFKLPTETVYEDRAGNEALEEIFGIAPPPDEPFRTYSMENTERDIVDVKPNMTNVTYKYGPSRYVPILPKRNFSWEIRLSPKFLELDKTNQFIEWEVFADNAPSKQDRIAIGDIVVRDRRTS